MSDYRAGSFVCCAAGCDRPKGHISHRMLHQCWFRGRTGGMGFEIDICAARLIARKISQTELASRPSSCRGGIWRNEMRSHITEIALAATLATALISATPALARNGQTSLALAAGHELACPTANDARAKRDHNYDRRLSQRSG